MPHLFARATFANSPPIVIRLLVSCSVIQPKAITNIFGARETHSRSQRTTLTRVLCLFKMKLLQKVEHGFMLLYSPSNAMLPCPLITPIVPGEHILTIVQTWEWGLVPCPCYQKPPH